MVRGGERDPIQEEARGVSLATREWFKLHSLASTLSFVQWYIERLIAPSCHCRHEEEEW